MLYLVEHAAAVEMVAELVEALASVLQYDQWLLLAHAANDLTDDRAAQCPCHSVCSQDQVAAQDVLW